MNAEIKDYPKSKLNPPLGGGLLCYFPFISGRLAFKCLPACDGKNWRLFGMGLNSDGWL